MTPADAEPDAGGGAELSAEFSAIRYAQSWEDADVLLEGLDVQPGDRCLSIASAGDNTLALLTRDPSRVVAVDLSPAQLACLELRVAAYRRLDHGELLELVGSRPSDRRPALYERCRGAVEPACRAFWDAHPDAVRNGIGSAGKFERYFRLFRDRALRLVHSRKRVRRLLQGGDRDARERFYESEWNTWRWRLLFRVFFSRVVMGRLGRDPSFFRYVEGSVADRILMRTRHALVELDPAANPYLQWILTGRHTTALPLALREEHFETIRSRVDRVEWHCASVQEMLPRLGDDSVDRFNLSDLFEYVSQEAYEDCLRQLCATGRRGGRLAYWNMLAPRSRPPSLADRLRPLGDLARGLHLSDKAFFYSAFVVEELR